MGDFAKKQSQQSRRASEESEFKSKFEISQKDYSDLIDYAKGHKLSLEDVYYLKNRNSRDALVADDARKDVVKQMQNVRQMPTSVASTGNVQVEDKSMDDAVFDKLLAQGAGLDKLM